MTIKKSGNLDKHLGSFLDKRRSSLVSSLLPLSTCLHFFTCIYRAWGPSGVPNVRLSPPDTLHDCLSRPAPPRRLCNRVPAGNKRSWQKSRSRLWSTWPTTALSLASLSQGYHRRPRVSTTPRIPGLPRQATCRMDSRC